MRVGAKKRDEMRLPALCRRRSFQLAFQRHDQFTANLRGGVDIT
jgi:hypothetical protein